MRFDYAVVLKCAFYRVAEDEIPEPVGVLSSDCEGVGEPLSHDEMVRRGTAGLQAAAGIIGSGAHPADRIAQWVRSQYPEAAHIADAIARGDYRS